MDKKSKKYKHINNKSDNSAKTNLIINKRQNIFLFTKLNKIKKIILVIGIIIVIIIFIIFYNMLLYKS